VSALSRFSLRELQDYVGAKVLDDLDALLPLIDPAFLEGLHYGSKQTLERMFVAFGGVEKLQDTQFRRDLLNHLSPSELQRIATVLGISQAENTSFESLVLRISSEAWSTLARKQGLLRELGLPESLAPQAKHKAPGLSIEPKPSRRYRPLLEYQASVYFEALRKLEVPRSRFMIQMPTGSGKTRTAMEIIAQIIMSRACDVVWLAHSGELCSQAAETFCEIWRHVGNGPVQLIRHYGESALRSTVILSDDPVLTITSFQQLHLKVASGISALPGFFRVDRIQLVVVDEAHKVIAPTYQKVTKALIGGQTACIGLTATPGRSVVNTAENEKLAAFFFERIVSFDSGDDSPIAYLRKRKVLARADYVPLRTNQTYTLTSQERRAAEKFLDLPAGFLSRVAADHIRNAEIVKRLKELVSSRKQVLFFSCSVDHSRFICSVLSYLGIRAGHIDGTTSVGAREEVIGQFRTGSISVLCNFEVLSTGFDAPKTDVVFVSRPTASVVLYSQMIGRGLRGLAVGGTESCLIVDVKDNIEGYSDLSATYSYFEEYWSPAA
jgi:superfamily II DNA or RNA helicase